MMLFGWLCILYVVSPAWFKPLLSLTHIMLSSAIQILVWNMFFFCYVTIEYLNETLETDVFFFYYFTVVASSSVKGSTFTASRIADEPAHGQLLFISTKYLSLKEWIQSKNARVVSNSHGRYLFIYILVSALVLSYSLYTPDNI